MFGGEMRELTVKLAEKSNCCGCSSCAYVCPQSAVTMVEADGVLLPNIDKNLCVSCRACEKQCPVIQFEKAEGNSIRKIYSAYSIHDRIRKKSSSGGISREIIDAFYNKYDNAVIYGSVIDENLEVLHMRTTCPSEFDLLYGSKYTTSNISQVFGQIKTDLINEKNVLFIGTPCQVASIDRLITSTEERNHLFLVDVICHGPGVTSVWNNYKSFLLRKYGKVKKFYFRDKSGGWRNYSMKIETEKKSVSNSPALKIWSYLFFRGYLQRESCFKCKFATAKRFSDITLGDFWSIEKINPHMADEGGVSFVAVNSTKGEHFLTLLGESVVRSEEEYASSIRTQENLNGGRVKPNDYEKFWDDYRNNGFLFVSKKYGSYNLSGQIRTRIIQLMRRTGVLQCIRKIIRK